MSDIFKIITDNKYTKTEIEEIIIKDCDKEQIECQTYKYLIRGRFGNEFYMTLVNKISQKQLIC